MSLNILTQNVRGLNNREKQEVFEEQAKTLQSQIVLIQEHMMNLNNKIEFKHYKTKQNYRRNNEQGGGTAIAVDTAKISETNNFIIKSIDLDVNLLEGTALEIKYKNRSKPFLFISTYLSPDLSTWVQKFQELKINISKFKFTHEIFIGGDWNAPLAKKKEKYHKWYQKILEWTNT